MSRRRCEQARAGTWTGNAAEIRGPLATHMQLKPIWAEMMEKSHELGFSIGVAGGVFPCRVGMESSVRKCPVHPGKRQIVLRSNDQDQNAQCNHRVLCVWRPIPSKCYHRTPQTPSQASRCLASPAPKSTQAVSAGLISHVRCLAEAGTQLRRVACRPIRPVRCAPSPRMVSMQQGNAAAALDFMSRRAPRQDGRSGGAGETKTAC